MQMTIAPRPRRPQTSGRNEGSVWWRDDRDVWVAEVSLPSGRTRTVHRKSKREARAALRVLLATVNAPPAMPPNCSLGTYLQYWLDKTANERDPKTQSGYRGIMENHVIQELGKVRLDRLSVAHLEWYFERAAAKRRLSRQTVKNHRMALQSAFNAAERWSILPRGSNPAAIAKVPPVPAIPRATLTVAEIRRFLRDPEPSRLFALFVLDLCAGARQSELLGLVWPEVSGATLHLNFQLAREGGAWVRKPLKTGHVRQVELPRAAVEALDQHRRQQAAERSAQGLGGEYDGLVFTSATGAPLYGAPVLEEWYASLERVGLPRLTFHDGRHSYVSALMHLGVDWRVSADQTGHSTAAMERHYSHGTPESRRQAAATLQAGLDEVPA